MEAWRATLTAHIQAMHEDDRHEDIIFNQFLDQVRDDSLVEPLVPV